MKNDTSLLSSESSSSSRTFSDVESAPLEKEVLFKLICREYYRLVHESGRVLPPKWTMPELMEAIWGDSSIDQGFLMDAYYDVMLCGTHSWGCEELLSFIDQINYAL